MRFRDVWITASRSPRIPGRAASRAVAHGPHSAGVGSCVTAMERGTEIPLPALPGAFSMDVRSCGPMKERPVELSDFRTAPNQGGHPELYEIENAALDPDGLLLDAMRTAAPWAGRTLLDLGCGSGFWLPGYADEAAEVFGVEPDLRLLGTASARDPRARVLHGSAEHIPLPDASVDVVHARFAYFFGPGSERGLAEVRRVLRPGGALVVVDNDWRSGQFADLLNASPGAVEHDRGRHTDAWWKVRGAERTEVMSAWRFTSRADFDAVLRMEFPTVAQSWLRLNPSALGLTYGYLLFTVRG
jgi:SAM-dependent methyltransferase